MMRLTGTLHAGEKWLKKVKEISLLSTFVCFPVEESTRVELSPLTAKKVTPPSGHWMSGGCSGCRGGPH